MAKEKRSPTAHRTPSQIKSHGRGYQATTVQKKRRAKRNAARAKIVKKRGAAAVRGKDVDHKKPLSKGGSNSSANLRISSVKKNRGHGMSKTGSRKAKAKRQA